MRLIPATLLAIGIAAFAVAAPLAATSAASSSNVVATTGSVSGTIVGSAGQPLAGIMVVLWDPEFDMAASARSLTNGSYTVTNVQPGSYTVEYQGSDLNTAPNVQAQFYNNTQVFAASTIIHVAAGQKVSLNQQKMQPGGEIKLRVLGPDGQVIPDFGVELEATPGVPYLDTIGYESGGPDVNGDVDFQGLLPIGYTLTYEECPNGFCHQVGTYHDEPLGTNPTPVVPIGGQVTSLTDVFDLASVVTSATTLSICPTNPTVGQPVTFTTSVTASNGSIPQGSVSLEAGLSNTQDGFLDATGTASFTTSALPVGTTNIYATYYGAGAVAGNTVSTTVTVGPASGAGAASSCGSAASGGGTGGGGGGGGTAVTAPSPTSGVDRIAGVDRVGTAVATSQAEFSSAGAGAVVLARADDYADALVGAPLAAAKNAPLLLTAGASLPSATEAELTRVLAAGGTVYMLGGSSAIPTSVATQLATMGYQTVRLAGATRYATATDVAAALGNPSTVLLATGTNYPDALAAGPAAAHAGGAILLTDGTALPSATAAYLAAHATTTYAIGGPASAADPAAISIQGSDRYSTAADVANRFFVAPTAVGVATGSGFADALAAASFLGRLGAPLLLTSPGQLPSSTTSYLTAAKTTVTSSYLFGGTTAVSTTVQTAIGAALGYQN
jgi:putative cell wall-binding protein